MCFLYGYGYSFVILSLVLHLPFSQSHSLLYKLLRLLLFHYDTDEDYCLRNCLVIKVVS